MPFKVRCKKCDRIIYQSQDIKTSDEILTKFDGRCPKCNKKLADKPYDVKIDIAKREETA